MKITLLYLVSHYIRVKNQRNIKSWDQQNYLVIRGFCYIRPLYNEVSLYDLWPYKRQNTGGSITKNYRSVDLTMMHICTKLERNPSRNVACRAHKRFPPKYDLWPYKRRNTGGSITKNNRHVEFTMIHLHTKFERNPSRNAAVRAHIRMWTKNDLWPYKRRNTGGSVTKNNTRLDFTKIHLHTKFERNPSRNAAVRAHTRMWTKIWPLTL